MENKYYDAWEFQQALSYMETDPIKANVKLKEYIDKYPKDYSMYAYYASSLITLGDFEEAEQFLDYLEEEYKKDKHFLRQVKKVEQLKKNLAFNRIRALSYLGKYEKLYEYCLNNRTILEGQDIRLQDVSLYCKKKMGKIDPSRRDGHKYFFRQLVEYQENDFLDHIKRHLADPNSGLDDPNKNIFTPDFPFHKVFEEIKKYIPSDKGICWGFFDDTYVFRYDGCGRQNNKLVNYFKVVCFHGTQDFITMVPVEEGENLPCVDLNYLAEKKDSKEPKKRMSQIEKFNKRFNRS